MLVGSSDEVARSDSPSNRALSPAALPVSVER